MVNAVLGAGAVPDIDRLEQEDEEVEAEVRVGGLPVVVCWVCGAWCVGGLQLLVALTTQKPN